MRTVEEVKKHLKRNAYRESYGASIFTVPVKTASGSGKEDVTFNKLNDAINGLLVKLWNDEEITQAFVFNENLNSKKPVLLALTGKRLLVSREESKVSDGFILSYTNYYYETEEIELKYVDMNKCRILEQKNESFFGKPKPSVNGNLILDDKNTLVSVNLQILDAIYKAVTKNIKALTAKSAHKTEEKDGYNPNGGSISKNAGNAGSSANSWNVAEIRKLYEDGIITREEMLDLIKSAVYK